VYLLRSNYLARKLKSQCQYTDIVYTFWFNQLTLAAVIFKRRYNLEIKIVSRAHGRDLYNERDPLAYLPFQWYMLKHADLVAPISLHGSIYLNGYYSNKFENVNTFYLGSRKTLSKLHTTESKLNIFTVVTCCTVRNVKRLHLLPNILNHLNFEVRWVHFGGLGNEDDDSTITEFKNNCSNMKNHVLFLNKGACSLEEILDFYSKEQPDVLLSLSESEGLPVSMMEALSYGIPIVGTDVGGVSEIITTETGVLVSKDFTTQEYVKAINVIIKSNLTHNDSRKIIINYWNQKFNINKNYKSFFNYLEKEI
jgi:glycosyltransferase involved in cell wall biosynthesis